MKINNTKWLFLIVLPMLAISGKVAGEIRPVPVTQLQFVVNFAPVTQALSNCLRANHVSDEQCRANSQVLENRAIQAAVDGVVRQNPRFSAMLRDENSRYQAAASGVVGAWIRTLCPIGTAFGQQCRTDATSRLEAAMTAAQSLFFRRVNARLNNQPPPAN